MLLLLRISVLITLFILGLNVPRFSISVSIAVFVLLFVYSFHKIPSSSLRKSDIIVNLLLIAFSVSYYIIIWHHGYIDPWRGARYAFAVTLFYFFGHYAFHFFNRNGRTVELLLPLVLLAGGFSVYVAGETFRAALSLNSFYIYSRRVADFWLTAAIPATILSEFSSLGVGLIPVAVWMLFSSKKTKLIIFLIGVIFLIGGIGIVSAFMLLNRSILVLSGLLVLVFLLYFLYIEFCRIGRFRLRLLFLAGSVLLLLLSFFTLDLSFLAESRIPILNRVSENNLGAYRRHLLLEGIRHVPDNMWGGKPYELMMLKKNVLPPDITTGLGAWLMSFPQFLNFESKVLRFPYHHNLWLDVQYFAGIFPFIFLMLFHAAHLKCLSVVVLSRKNRIMGMAVLGLTVAVIFYFMIEAVLLSAFRYFLASCFLLAYIRQFSKSKTFRE